MLINADFLQNPGEKAIAEATLWIQDQKIIFAGHRQDLPKEAQKELPRYELQGMALFPGLVNAHAHLELTELEGLNYPGDFVAWIRDVLQKKNDLDPQTSNKSFQKGILRTLLGGCTTIADHASVTSDIETLLNSPLRGKIFLEMIGVVPEVATEIYKIGGEIRAQLLAQNSQRWELILSPHSIHALDSDVLEKILMQQDALLSIHLAESEAEHDFFKHRRGSMFDLIAERVPQSKPRQSSAIRELRQRNMEKAKILVVHGNYLEPDELDWIAQNHFSIVHCPFSHAYFSHRKFPLDEILKRNINLALGSDSLASAETLSMFEVLRKMKADFPYLSEMQIFEMATRGGAQALELENKIGQLKPGWMADLIAVPLVDANPLTSLFVAPQVEFLMVDGEVILNSV